MGPARASKPGTTPTMNQYLLSVHTVAGHACPSTNPEAMQDSYQRIGAVEEEMKSEGAWLFSGKLTEPETATVVRMAEGELLTTDGPFTESKEHLGGFYIIEAADLDAALRWAGKVTDAVGMPIEVRPFWAMATG